MQAGRLKILLELLADEPQDPFNRYAVAMEYIHTLPNEALMHLDIMLKEHPDYLPTYYQAGTLYAERDEQERATDIFEEGISLAEKQNNVKILQELKGAFQMYKDEWDF